MRSLHLSPVLGHRDNPNPEQLVYASKICMQALLCASSAQLQFCFFFAIWPLDQHFAPKHPVPQLRQQSHFSSPFSLPSQPCGRQMCALRMRGSPATCQQASPDRRLQLPFAHCPHPCYLLGVAAGAGSSRRRTEGPQQTAAAESSSRCGCRHQHIRVHLCCCRSACK